MEIALMTLAGFISFLAGVANGMMDISMAMFQKSKIKHWNPEFWEFFGLGQAWANKYVNKDIYAKVRVAWKPKIFGRTIRIVKPVIILDGWHMMKFFWRVLIVLAVIPIAIICHDIDGAVVASAMLYFPQVAGFYTILYFLVKKS